MSIPRETVEQRKAMPLATGVLDYFPDALLVVAEVSRIGNEQHHPGEPLHWDKSKSTDQADALVRHLLDRGTLDTDGVRHSAKVAWRALALLQTELDAETLATHEGPCEHGVPCRDYPAVEEWGSGDGNVVNALIAKTYSVLHSAPAFHDGPIPGPNPTVTLRGEWPPDTRVGGLLTCCGQSEHPLTCPHYR